MCYMHTICTLENAKLCRKNVVYAHFAEICEKCVNKRNMQQLHICIKLTCLHSVRVVTVYLGAQMQGGQCHVVSWRRKLNTGFFVFQWQNSPAEILAQGQTIVKALSDASKLAVSGQKSLPNYKTAVNKCFSTLNSSYDQKMGGFGRAPKFPQPGYCYIIFCVRVLYISVIL